MEEYKIMSLEEHFLQTDTTEEKAGEATEEKAEEPQEQEGGEIEEATEEATEEKAEEPQKREQEQAKEEPTNPPPKASPKASALEIVKPPSQSGKKKQEPPKEGERPAVSRREAETTAEAFTSFLNFVVSRGCAMFSGLDPERYEMQDKEKKAYIKTATDFFELERIKVSPKVLFLTSTLTIFSGIFYLAYKDYQREKKKKEEQELQKLAAEKAAKAKIRKLQTKAAPLKIERAKPKEEPITAPKKKEEEEPLIYWDDVPEAVEGRANFEIYEEDATDMGGLPLTGHYRRSSKNKRLKQEDALKADPPSPYVAGMIRTYRKKRFPTAQISKLIREHLKTLPKRKY